MNNIERIEINWFYIFSVGENSVYGYELYNSAAMGKRAR